MTLKIPENLENISTEIIETDLLIIGGGNAGCFSAIEAKKLNPDLKVTIMEKAHISRSGACSAGMDAINTYIPEGKTPEDLVRWCRSQVGGGPLREDLVLSCAEELNESVDDLEQWGLPILRDDDDNPRYRGKWDISIHGEALKPIMAEKAIEVGAEVYNRIVGSALLMSGDQCIGAMGFGVRNGKFYIFKAKATIVATGGACGLYKSYTSDSTDSHHQTWMCPFNVGTGYAMGIKAGAEFTSMEQRWVATRSKDFCGPIDTISVGYKSNIINAKGEKILEERYAHLGGDQAPRYIRANAPMEEWLEGRGPTYADTTHLSDEEVKDLKVDYLNERPSYVLFLAARGQDITKEPIEIYGSDPYIVGGHTGSGYWVEMDRMTTIKGLFAAGETAGGNPNKFVGGCAAEGKLATRGAMKYMDALELPETDMEQVELEKKRIFEPLFKGTDFDGVKPREMEERLQRLMDEYAGGSSQFYRTNEERLNYCLKHLKKLKNDVQYLQAGNLHDLMLAHEVIDRLDVAEIVCHHLSHRKETRWQGWQTRSDYPETNPEFDCFVESRLNTETNEIETFTRPYEQIIQGDRYKE
ncbi:MAG: adenylyl-sulfate reductase subunit alpha [Calditrichaeota bacterium]|jgi:adenylylsulfate reductase, subunit A|nr:adenylyl-sulfate reductase subunit alpha [Deltaproteobacteria bacterium]MBT7616039.1 adenylyl-sulfate reductase subunit alpha [Calditrichota bacterium]